MQKIRETIDRIEPLDEGAMERAKERQDTLTKPRGSLGVLEELSIRMAGIMRDPMPKIRDKVIITMAGDHGVVEEGVSAYPQEVTPQMVYNFIDGGAGVNVLARHVGARIVVVDMGVATDLGALAWKEGFIGRKINYGTKNMAKGPAMTREEAIRSVEAGIGVFEEELTRGLDIVCTGDMGIGNTTPSCAIVAVITGAPVKEVTGRGTGIDDATFERKVKIIEKALEVNKPDPKDPMDVLSKVGGFEIGGIAGVILGAAANQKPVVIDSFVSSAGALIATELAPLAKRYIIASHNPTMVGHRLILQRMGLRPLLDLHMRLGEGTCAALGMSIVEASTRILTEMATFADAEVSGEIS